MIRVLSIDGGGIRGIIPAAVLAELEKRSGRRVVDLFDLIVGTSTGGILALALTCPRDGEGPRSAEEIGSIYLQRAANIFPLGGIPNFKIPWKRRIDARLVLAPEARGDFTQSSIAGNKLNSFFGGNSTQGNARYPSEPLERELQSQLGDALMSAALKPVAVVSCDLKTRLPLIFRGGGLASGFIGNAKMRHAARATSAGPTFFQPLNYKDETGVARQCADGGLVANDPAFVGFTEAALLGRLRGSSLDDIMILSLGTGEKETGRPSELDDTPALSDTRPWWNLLPVVADTLSASPGELMRQQLAQLMGPNYIRVQTTVGFGAAHAMDNVLPTNLEALQKTAMQMIADQSTVLDSFLARIA
jgi:patatin-like phospholipase/acyl hydrolase